MPAKTAATMPETKLGGEKEAAKNNPIVPPKIVENKPRYGPRIIPIIGAVIAASVIALVGKPIMGKAGMKEEYM
jgi:hypothetical protein